jgi:pyrroloquinoline-quinone synthase
MMRGLGFDLDAFGEQAGPLHESAVEYRGFLRARSAAEPWQAAVAILTIFVEGSVNERAELEGRFVRPTGEEAVANHAMVVHYGCPPEAMDLVRAHTTIEGGHRRDAWRVVLEHAKPGTAEEDAVLQGCEEALSLWHLYRDGVAERMGLSRSIER